MTKTIVLIGAGSAAFTQGLLADLVLSKKPWHLRLVDVDPEALAVGAGLARRMAQARQAEITIEASVDRCDMLPGADVVVSTIGVGGRQAWEIDFKLPREFGVFQPVADTAMAGGISRALRMVPAMVDIARDVLRLAPQARFFNYANPMTAVCQGVRRATGADMVGLCIGVHHVQNELADFIGKPRNEVTALAAGVNHFTWMYDLRWGGADAWGLVRAQLAAERNAGQAPADIPVPGGDSTQAPADWRAKAAHNPFSWSLFEAYGAYPAVNDRHVVEFFPERFPRGNYYGRTLGIDVFSMEESIRRGNERYARMRSQALGEAPLDEAVFNRTTGEHSQLLEILDAIDRDQRRTFSANVPNRGAVPNLPADAILELTCVATGRGLQPIALPTFSDSLAAPLVRKIASIGLTVDAALRGDRKLFVEALLADGCVAENSTAGKLADALLAAQAQHLPQFA